MVTDERGRPVCCPGGGCDNRTRCAHWYRPPASAGEQSMAPPADGGRCAEFWPITGAGLIKTEGD